MTERRRDRRSITINTGIIPTTHNKQPQKFGNRSSFWQTNEKTEVKFLDTNPHTKRGVRFNWIITSLCFTWTVYRTQANKNFLPTSRTLFILALTSNRLIHKLFGRCRFFATKLDGYCNTFAPYVTTKTRPTLTQEKHHRRQPNSSIKTANLPSHTGVNRFKEIRMFWCPPERPKLKQSFFFH